MIQRTMDSISGIMLLAVVVIVFTSALSETSQIHITGYHDVKGRYTIDIDSRIMEEQILALLIYAKPSNTLIHASIDQKLPAEEFDMIRSQNPKSMTVGPNRNIAAIPSNKVTSPALFFE